jgi:hypothetical protein
MAMHGLRSAILKGEKGAAVAPASTEEACRRKGPRDPSRLPTPERIRDERRVAVQRRNPRHREIVERATIVYERKRSLAQIVNVSATGLTIETAVAPQIGETILVELPAGPVEGVVRWLKKGRIGLDVEGGIALGKD